MEHLYSRQKHDRHAADLVFFPCLFVGGSIFVWKPVILFSRCILAGSNSLFYVVLDDLINPDQLLSRWLLMTVRHMLNGYITADNLSIFIIFTIDKHHVPHPNCPSLHTTERWHGQRLSACARRSTGKPLAIIKYIQQLLLQVYLSLFHYKRTKVYNIKSISIPCKTSGWWSQPVHNKSSIVSIFPKITCKLSSSIIETANQTTHILPLGSSIWRKISEHLLV